MPPMLTIARECIGECDADSTTATIPAGVMVEYLGHVPGGMVLVRYHEKKYVIHPGATAELA